MKRTLFDQRSIVFFDGVCLLCQGAVHFILKHDKREQFYFASLQSEFSRKFLEEFSIKSPSSFQSLILWHRGEIFTRSAAVITLGQQLSFPWNLLSSLGKIFPKSLLDKIYNFISKRRYNWFGKDDICMVPESSFKYRFLD